MSIFVDPVDTASNSLDMPVSATPYKERNETSLGIDRHISKEDSVLLCTSICILYCVPDTIEHVAVREDTNVDIWN